MHKSFDTFLVDYDDVFKQNPLLIPRKVVQELQRIEKKRDHRLQTTQVALRSVESAVANATAQIRGEQSDDHTAVADHVISRVVEQHISQHNIVVLTNDRMLRSWIYSKKRAGCFSSRNSLLVVRFGPQNGTPHIWGDAPVGDPDKNSRPAPTFRPQRPGLPRCYFSRSASILCVET